MRIIKSISLLPEDYEYIRERWYSLTRYVREKVKEDKQKGDQHERKYL